MTDAPRLVSIERLEERAMLTVYTVTTLDDQPFNFEFLATEDLFGLSLREAIGLANHNEPLDLVGGGDEDGDQIVFDPSLNGTITLDPALGELLITDDVRITGGNVITIDGGDLTRLFRIDLTDTSFDGDGADGTVHNVVLSTLSLVNGNAGVGNGGAILNQTNGVTAGIDTNLQLTGVTATGNSASFGGAVATTATNTTAGAKTLTIVGSTFNGNAATLPTGNGGGVHLGGGSNVTVGTSTFVNNAASNGGGLWLGVGSTLAVNQSTIGLLGNGNTAAGSGGGLFNGGGTLDINQTTIAHNTASGGGGLAQVGLLAGPITNSTFSNNQATNGGAALIFGGSRLTVVDSTVNGNGATIGGAFYAAGTAQLEVSRSSLNFNTSADQGGAIAGGGGSTIRVEDSTLFANTAARGGGLYVIQSNSAQVVNSTISRNTATTGGAVHASAGALTLLHTTAVDNRSTDNAAGLFLQAGVNTILRNSLIIGNRNLNGNFFQDIVGTVQFGGTPQRFSGYNLVGTAGFSGGLQDGRSGNKVGFFVLDVVDNIARDNGGPTLTNRLVAGGPAVNAGDPAFTPPPFTDQRGFSRVSGGLLDIGSVELDLV